MALKKKYLDKNGLTFFWSKIEEKLKNKANISSPELQGTPLAPTAEKDTANNQIATTKFVKEAIDQALSKINTTQIIVTISPAVQATVVLTNRSTQTVFSATTDPNTGIAILKVNEYGLFDITYQSSGTINSVSNINIQETEQIYQISATYTRKITYTAIIDLNNSNPLNCITYADDALGKTKGSSDWDNEIIFKDIKPCVFKNGKVIYYLNKDDCTKQEDGSAANLDGTDGDVMVEFSKFAYCIYKDETNKVYVSITNDADKVAADDRYHYYAFSKKEEGDCQHFYFGAYKGSLDDDGKLQSITNQNPASNKTLEAFKQAAQSKGSGYSITSYFQLVALQCLYIIKYGNLNGQVALGQGICNRSDETNNANYGPLQTGGTTTFSAGKKMYYGDPYNDGSSSDYNRAKLGHVKFAGIEDFWGSIWELIDGLTIDSNGNIVTNWDYDKQNFNQSFSVSSGLTNSLAGYIKNVLGTSETGFIGIDYAGSQTTYFCDYGKLSLNCILKFGGRWNSTLICGPFCLYVDSIVSSSDAKFGARLMYINNN